MRALRLPRGSCAQCGAEGTVHHGASGWAGPVWWAKQQAHHGATEARRRSFIYRRDAEAQRRKTFWRTQSWQRDMLAGRGPLPLHLWQRWARPPGRNCINTSRGDSEPRPILFLRSHSALRRGFQLSANSRRDALRTPHLARGSRAEVAEIAARDFGGGGGVSWSEGTH